MNSEIKYLHHVGHVVHDIEKARAFYRQLGFLCTVHTYPTLVRQAGEQAQPFGAANMHASFARNFIEIMAVVNAESHLPEDARPIPLQIPPAALPRVIETIENTLAKISASLERFEGLHILVWETEDAELTAQRFEREGVGHSGVSRVQQPGQSVPMGVIEIDREIVPEGRLAVAERPVIDPSQAQDLPHHPNGAVDLLEVILCTPGEELAEYAARYQRYLGCAPRKDGEGFVFDLQQSCVRLVPGSSLGTILPGEKAPALPAFVAYAVAVRDLAATRRWLENNGVSVNPLSTDSLFVPSHSALGAAIIFRQAV